MTAASSPASSEEQELPLCAWGRRRLRAPVEPQRGASPVLYQTRQSPVWLRLSLGDQWALPARPVPGSSDQAQLRVWSSCLLKLQMLTVTPVAPGASLGYCVGDVYRWRKVLIKTLLDGLVNTFCITALAGKKHAQTPSGASVSLLRSALGWGCCCHSCGAGTAPSPQHRILPR